MEICFDTYYRFDEMQARLAWLAGQFPHIVQLSSLGASAQGRLIPLLTLTRHDTGLDTEKPALWIDGNIHASEVAASAAVLYIALELARAYGRDPQVTRILDEQTIYAAPRLDPDGAERCLQEHFTSVRSGIGRQAEGSGLWPADVDGDGRILQMRIPDPSGDWKIADDDPRLMVPRDATEEGDGPYYALVPEGFVTGYDGYILRLAPTGTPVDFNRSFPADWQPAWQQAGAGEHPGAAPEVAALLGFFSKHPNIFGALSYHTPGRVLLRPFFTRPDDEMDALDRWIYDEIGRRGERITGYPYVSAYHGYRSRSGMLLHGSFTDWLYSHRGILAFTVELWDLPDAAGVAPNRRSQQALLEWFQTRSPAQESAVAAFVDRHYPAGLAAWRPFHHPQLGLLEIGGWDELFAWQNPPPALLEAEVAPHLRWVIDCAAIAPRLAWCDVTAVLVANDLYRLTAVVENRGFLPTSGSARAGRVGVAGPVYLTLELPAGASLVGHPPEPAPCHLEGRSQRLLNSYLTIEPRDNRTRSEWLVHARRGTIIEIHAWGERAGALHRVVRLGE